MKTFEVSKKIKIECESKSNSKGFIHKAKLKVNDVTCNMASIQYYNRTWESYDFESILFKLAKKAKVLSKEEKVNLMEFIKNPNRVKEELQPLKRVANVMALGEFFCKTLKEKNAWKLRMLKAEFKNKGLLLPDDFDDLDEETKEVRLNSAIEVLKN